MLIQETSLTVADIAEMSPGQLTAILAELEARLEGGGTDKRTGRPTRRLSESEVHLLLAEA